MSEESMNQETIDVLCHQCGQEFSSFLHQMADKNAKVVCPNCRENEDCEPPHAAPTGGERPIRRKI
jgi:DNA-directed RNA polymerase subunit RPC12/RpoP